MFIDFHTHIFPDSVAPVAVKHLIEGTARVEGRALPPRHDATEEGMLEQMKRECVPLAVILPIVTKPSQTESILAFAENLNARHRKNLLSVIAYLKKADGFLSTHGESEDLPVVMNPHYSRVSETETTDFPAPALISFASVHPEAPDAEDTLKRIAEKGFLGIKLHPEFQNFYIDSPRSIKILSLAEELGLITVLHAGKDIGMPPPVHASPGAISHLFDYMQGDRLVAAHLGGFRMWDDVEKYLVGKPLYLDTAYLGFWDGEPWSEQFRRIIRTHGAKKILFGSDSPWKSFREVIARVKTLCLTDEEMKDIFRDNALKLLFSSSI